MRTWIVWFGTITAVCGMARAAEPSGRVSVPQAVMISVYDSGYALCNELRTFDLTRGPNIVPITDVPRRLLPMTVALISTGRTAAPNLLDCVWWGKGEAGASEKPLLQSRLESAEEGPVHLRMMYGAEGLSWRALYVLLLREGQTVGSLNIRVALDNRIGGSFQDARVRLVETQRGGFVQENGEKSRGSKSTPATGGLRYLYGESEPQMERLAASPALSRTFDLPTPVRLLDETTTYVTLLEQPEVPVARFYVYDGVSLDRFEKNPRNDWNYGTASQPLVDSYLEILLTGDAGSAPTFPRGRLMAVLLRNDETADVLGYGMVRASDEGTRFIRAQMGPAIGLRGSRERVSYSEVTPFKEYEEAFSIRIDNDSEEDAEVRVVEHLYRWPVYEIVKADTEYQTTGRQTIEFRPLVKAHGNRVINYTVRYRW